MRLYLEKALHKNRAGGVAQGAGPEFKPSTTHKKRNTYEYPLKKIKRTVQPMPT
jgi:hypothetical protein